MLLRFARVPAAGGGEETVCLALETIENHAYERSRFLRGATIDESRIDREAVLQADSKALSQDALTMRWAGTSRTQFERLDKPIVFDDAQDQAFQHPAPLVVIGSAGSGKTAVTVSRLRETEGSVLYVTHSAYLAQSARSLYGAHGFESPKHEVEFLSYSELLQTLRVPKGREVALPAFSGWCDRNRQSLRGLSGLDAQAVTSLANRLLKIKQARFGSVDRESNFLVQSSSTVPGEVRLLEARPAAIERLDAATRRSARHAVIVLRDEDKLEARKVFRTPLIFSVHEAKGLEYPHVILFGLVSGERSAYREVCEGVSSEDLSSAELEYRRARDKADKSLEIYKFHVNALYVAMTRAIETLTLVEHDIGHPLLELLNLQQTEPGSQTVAQSTQEEWAQEARKLELQGKTEQAQAIRDNLLQHKPVPWTPWGRGMIEGLLPRALDPRDPSSKPKQALFDYAAWHGQQRWITELAGVKFAPAGADIRRIFSRCPRTQFQ